MQQLLRGSSMSTASSHEEDVNVSVFGLDRLQQEEQASFDLLHSD